MRPPPTALALALTTALAGLASPAAADLESDLASRWRGAWTLSRTEAYSDCGSFFTNNAVRGRLVSGKGDYRFAPGEVVKVEKLGLQRARIDLLVTVDEPLRLVSHDGPFTLYEQARCRVELRIEVPRVSVRSGAIDDLDRAVAEILARFDSPDAARDDPGWNRREVEPLPQGYAETFARYHAWKADQANAAVAARIDEAIEEAARLTDRLDDDPDYLAGFAAGVDRARDAYFGDCGSLLSGSVYGFTSSPPRGRQRAWRDGYEDGQKLVYYLELARRLRGCFIPVPPVR